jgi:tetrahydromethanopterin S-methyltransferase subunit A
MLVQATSAAHGESVTRGSDGEDTEQAVGHLPGQSLECLFRNGLNDRGRINGARGRRPVLKNVSRQEVRAFLNQVELVPLIGEQDEEILNNWCGSSYAKSISRSSSRKAQIL